MFGYNKLCSLKNYGFVKVFWSFRNSTRDLFFSKPWVLFYLLTEPQFYEYHSFRKLVTQTNP